MGTKWPYGIQKWDINGFKLLHLGVKKMAELIINTNEVIENKGRVEKDILTKQEVEEKKSTMLLEEINRKLDLLISEKEDKNGETKH